MVSRKIVGAQGAGTPFLATCLLHSSGSLYATPKETAIEAPPSSRQGTVRNSRQSGPGKMGSFELQLAGKNCEDGEGPFAKQGYS